MIRVAMAAPLDTVGIITHRRAAHLKRAIDSLLAHARSCDVRIDIVVVDGGSNDSLEANQPQEHVGRIGHREFDRYLRAGIDAAVPPLVKDALRLGPTGANRNALTLLTAGKRVLCQDDDIVTIPWQHAAANQSVLLGNHSDPREWTFCKNAERACSVPPAQAANLFEAHAHILGAGIDERAMRLEADSCQHMRHAARNPQGYSVTATMSGLCGDSGWSCPYRALLLTGQIRNQLMSDERTFIRAMTSRYVRAVATSYGVTHSTTCMAYSMGIDNRTLVPPFLPQGRNEDGAWAAVLAAVDARALYAHVPVGVCHRPPEARSYRNDMPSARGIRLADAIIAVTMMVAASIEGTTRAQRMSSLGRYLSTIAAGTEGAFMSSMRHAIRTMMAGRIGALRHQADSIALPMHWRRGCAQYANLMKDSIETRSFYVAEECREPDDVRSTSRMQAHVMTYGQLLLYWPTLWQNAQSLNGETGK